MSNTTIAKGSCLCGAVSLSTSSLNPHVAACNCNMCRKWGGGPLMATECGNDLSLSGEENISIYQSSDWAERGFCKICGTHLFYRLKENHQYYIPAGIFGNEEEFTLTHQVFIDEKPEYYSFKNKTKDLTGAEIFAQFTPSEKE